MSWYLWVIAEPAAFPKPDQSADQRVTPRFNKVKGEPGITHFCTVPEHSGALLSDIKEADNGVLSVSLTNTA